MPLWYKSCNLLWTSDRECLELKPWAGIIDSRELLAHKGAIFLTFMYRKEFYNQSFKCNFFNVSDTLIDLHYISRITGLQDDNTGYSGYSVLKTSFWEFCKWDLIWRRTKHKDNFIKRGRWERVSSSPTARLTRWWRVRRVLTELRLVETGPIHAIFPIIRVLVWTMPITIEYDNNDN